MLKTRFISFIFLIAMMQVVVAEDDPWEDFNRNIFTFNQSLDTYVLKPVATNYKEHTPDLVQKGASNFLSNLGDLKVAANQFLQLKFTSGITSLTRFVVNSTVGVYGLFDVASNMDLPKGEEDFGQTLAKWGVSSGPYIVVPILGPSTLRDTVGGVIERQSNLDSRAYLRSSEQLGVNALTAVDARVKLLPFDQLLNQSQDPYIRLRVLYLQKRKYDIHDGTSLWEDDFDDF